LFNKVLVATDGSDNAQKALEYVKGLLEKNIAGQAVVIHVTPKIIGDDHRGTELQIRAQQLANVEAEQVVKKAQATFSGAANVSFISLRGNAHEQIVKYAKDNQMDLIVMGRQGVSKIVEFFIGSTTNEVVRRSTVPVLTL